MVNVGNIKNKSKGLNSMTLEDVRGTLIYMLGDMEIIPETLITEYVYFINKYLDCMNFSFSLCSGGIKSRNLMAYLNELLEEDYITIDGVLRLTELGEKTLGEIYCDNSEIIGVIQGVIDTVSRCNLQEIKVACIADNVMTSKVEKYGISSLMKEKEQIIKIVGNFVPKYMSDDNFYNGIRMMNELDLLVK